MDNLLLCCKKKMDNLLILLTGDVINRDRKIWTVLRSSTFFELEVPLYTDERFREQFRMSRKSFEELIKSLQCLKQNDTTMREAICLDKRIAIGLYSLDTSAEFRTVANLFGIGLSTVRNILYEFCEAVCENLGPKYLKFYPPSDELIHELVGGFEQIWGFPQVYGAIDGCYIEINPVKEEAVDYYNYKGWYSMVLLAAVDYRYRFTYINVGSPGKNNDSYVFENSRLKQQHEKNSKFYHNSKLIKNISVPIMLLGDSAFRQSQFLMKPYPGSNLDAKKAHFNYMLSRSRRVVENAFLQMKGRFRKIGRGLEVSIEHVPLFIRACCILHNYLNEKNEIFAESWINTINKDNPELHFNSLTSTGVTDVSSNLIKNALTEYLYENRDVHLSYRS